MAKLVRHLDAPGCHLLLGTLAFDAFDTFFRYDELSSLCRYTDHPPLFVSLTACIERNTMEGGVSYDIEKVEFLKHLLSSAVCVSHSLKTHGVPFSTHVLGLRLTLPIHDVRRRGRLS